ncbi:MAG: alpha/beta fold hydrolase [Actinomycetota bacterium]|nr:alpha/beta fold hydrolase [Actinomycetota bacterium]
MVRSKSNMPASEAGEAKLKSLELPRDVEVMEDGRPFFFKGGDIGCLLIHGFTGTTQSMRLMGEYLGQQGLTVLCPRLPGHGTNVKDMARWRFTDWTDTVELAFEELKSICREVFVGGLSMGGTLTLYMGETKGEEIRGLIPICAPVFMRNPVMKLVPILKYVVKAASGVGNDIKDPQMKEVAYEKVSLEAVHEFTKLMNMVRRDLYKVTLPIRIFQARGDHVVPTDNAKFIYDHVTSSDKELIWLENSYHVATLDFDRQELFEKSLEFIREKSS